MAITKLQKFLALLQKEVPKVYFLVVLVFIIVIRIAIIVILR